MSRNTSGPADLIVLGAGPAGAEAAIAASEAGLRVLVIDEATAAGGQVFRKPLAPTGDGPDANAAEGDQLRWRLAGSRARFVSGRVVWNVAARATGDGFEVATLGPDGLEEFASRAVVVATGATERFYARPGWTLPGVVGLAAATVMLKSFKLLPGRRVVVAGSGPLLSLVAHLIIEGGGQVAAVVDSSPFSEWLGKLPRMASRPDLLLRGVGWQMELISRRVPVHRGCELAEIRGHDQVDDVRIVRRSDGREVVVAADAVCLGHGLVPATEVYRLLNADQVYRPEAGGWVPELDDLQRTSVKGVYAAGDGACLLGAAAAPLTGRLAALAAARDLGFPVDDDVIVDVQAALARAGRFGAAMAWLSRPRPQAMAEVPGQTIVCRCEDITAAEIRDAAAAGARTLNALKSATRCGMGPCGGRSCSESAAALLECAGVSRVEIGQPTARPPLRPIALAAITGDFAYPDIPLPEPAPA